MVTALLVVIMSSSVMAFELVEEEAKDYKYSLGLESGVVFGEDMAQYFGVCGNYDLTEKTSIQGVFGQKLVHKDSYAYDESSYDKKLLYGAKYLYRLKDDSDYGFYLLGLAGNFDEGDISLGAGFGGEWVYGSLPEAVRTGWQFAYTSQKSFVINCSINFNF